MSAPGTRSGGLRGVYRRHARALSVVVFGASLALALAVVFVPLDPQQLVAFGYGGIFLITLLGALSLFIPGPTMIAAFAIGSVLDPFWVSVVAGLGSALGETTGYAAGYASRALVAPRENPGAWYARILSWVRAYPFVTLFVLSAVPNMLTDLGGLVAGRTQYSYPRFLVATFLGKTVRFGLSAYLGARLGGFWPGR